MQEILKQTQDMNNIISLIEDKINEKAIKIDDINNLIEEKVNEKLLKILDSFLKEETSLIFVPNYPYSYKDTI
jgi:hypothetical protein